MTLPPHARRALLGAAALASLTVGIALSAPARAPRASRERPPDSAFTPYTTPHAAPKKSRTHAPKAAAAPPAASAPTPPQLAPTRPRAPGAATLVELPPTHDDATPQDLPRAPAAPPPPSPQRWMAQPSERERLERAQIITSAQQRIQAQLDRRASEHDARRVAGALVQARARACFGAIQRTQPDAQGRLTIEVDLHALHGRGAIARARVREAVSLKQPALHRCIADGLAGTRFETTGPSGVNMTTRFGVRLP